VRVDEHTIDLAGSPVFYRSAPAGDTTPLYLHGVPTSSDDWIPFLERSGGLAPDLIGFGRSSKAGHLDYSIDGHAEFVQVLLDQLGVQRVALVAHDWGAGGGLAFAQRHPDRVERLVLINAVPLLPNFRWHRLARTLRRPLVGELVMGSTPQWLLRRTMRRGGRWSDEQLAGVWEQFDQGTQRAILRLHRDGSERRLAQAGNGLASLDLPSLVVWGEHDPWLPIALGEAYAGRLPNATLERIQDAGHWPWLEQPGVVDRIVEFLR
jgi:pimeloyl-ACP methyl ester carboxylesterase